MNWKRGILRAGGGFTVRWLLPVVLGLIVGSASPAPAQQYNEANDFSYALKLFNEGFYDIAAQQFSTFINRYPNSGQLADAHYYLGESLFQQGDYANARVEFQSLAVGFPQHERAPQAWKRVGECYRKLKNWSEAAKAFETIKILYPDHPLAPEGLLEAAQIYLQTDQLARCEQALREFLDRYVESAAYPQGRLLYGRLLEKKGQLEAARVQYQKVLEITGQSGYRIQATLGLARVQRKLGFPGRAADALKQVVAASPADKQVYPAVLELAGIYLDQNQPENALAVLKDASARFTSAAQKRGLARLKVAAQFMAGDYFAARQEAEKFVEDDSLGSLFRFYLAACLQEEGQIDRAVQQYSRALPQLEQSGFTAYARQARLNLIDLYLSRGNVAMAVPLLEKLTAKTLWPDEVERRVNALILAAIGKGQLALGEQWNSRLLRSNPHSPFRDDLAYALGKAYFLNRQLRQAREKLSQFTGTYFASEWADSAQFYLDFMTRHLPGDQQVGLTRLTGLLGELLMDEPRDRLLFELGQIYLNELKDYPRAVQIFQQTLKYATDSLAQARSHYYLSEAYLRWWELSRFRKQASDSLREKAAFALKQAMIFLNQAPHPDTLVYRYLNYGLDQQATPPDRLMEFWQHFVVTYPRSKLRGKALLKLADLSLATGDTTGALGYLDQAAEAGGSASLSGLALWKKAQVLAGQNRLDEAVATLKQMLLNYPHHSYQARGYSVLASWLEKQGDYLGAAQAWERLHQQFDYFNQASFAPMHIAQNYLAAGEYQKALAFAEPLVARQKPASDWVLRHYSRLMQADLYYFAGKGYFHTGDFVRARQYLFAYLQYAPEKTFADAAYFHLGKMAYQEHDYDAALLHFSFVKARPDSPYFREARELSAEILFQQNKYAEALQIYDQLLKLNGSDAGAALNYSTRRLMCLLHEGRSSEFQKGLARLRKQKSTPELQNALAAIEFEQAKISYQAKNFDAAIRHCETILKKYKKSDYADDALYYMGLCYTTLNRAEKALDKLSRFIKTYPDSPLLGQVYITMGNLYYRGEKNELALDAFRKALDVARDAPARRAAMTNLIKMYQDLGLWDGVLKLARQYVEEFPRAEDHFDKRILVGIALSRLNRYAEAVDYLKKLKIEASSEQEPEIQFYIGEAYFNAGQYENAIREFVKIPLLSRKTKLQWEASALYFSGQAYERLGRKQDAIRMYQEIID
ncbi:MAG: outer membrane protein assembly factor BamD, partial [Calditrichaeota bacterium]